MVKQPRRGETPKTAHTPQKVNSMLISIINLLSVVRFLGISNFKKNPKNAPIIINPILITMGIITSTKLTTTGLSPAERKGPATDKAMLKAIRLSTSSRAMT